VSRPAERPGRATVELAAAAAFAAAAYLVLARPPAAPPPPPPAASPAAAAANADDAVALYGAGAGALLALPYSEWDENTDPSQLGVTVHDPERAWPGWNLFTNEAKEAHLIDLDGRRVHTWWAPKGINHCELAELLDDGDLLLVCLNQGLVRLDWDSNLIWMARHNVHHDVAVFADGMFVVPIAEPKRMYQGWRVMFDGLVELTADGVATGWRWSSYQQLDALRALHGPLVLDTPPPAPSEYDRDYYHLNSVEALPPTPLGEEDPRFRAGNLLVNLRNANMIVVLDRRDSSVLWHWGMDVLDLAHAPTMLPNGHLLIFDNGALRKYSRVIEVDPRDGEIVWQYQGDPPSSFFSIWRGAAQRLGNGNTLITEAERGHLFEVTPAGEMVWEYWNPDLVNGKRRRIYRVFRVGVERMREIRQRRAKRPS
jgi:outer membrane protein assembly factor BamB